MSLHGNTGSHPAFDAGHQVPSHEPDSDPTGQMDHMTLMVTRLDSDRVQTGSQLICLSAYIPPHGMLALSLLLWKSVADMKL